MLCCCLRTVDLMHGFTQSCSVCHSLSAVWGGGNSSLLTFLNHYLISWVLLVSWVSWVTDDVMATRKKEVSERHMRGIRRVGSVYEGEYVLYSTKALVMSCLLSMPSIWFSFYTELDIQCLMEGSECLLTRITIKIINISVIFIQHFRFFIF